jgi:3-dehydroquinate dehydratase-2
VYAREGDAISHPICIAVLHGPNLNLLGQREPSIYGLTTLDEIDRHLVNVGAGLSVDVTSSQHQGEGELVQAIQSAAASGAHGFLINPAAYTHTSVAIRDALSAVNLPSVEIHLTNVYAREPFRHKSVIADIVVARVMGFGALSYELGLRGLVAHLQTGC